jgi:hypothetical protein
MSEPPGASDPAFAGMNGYKPGAIFEERMKLLERKLIIWCCSLIFLAAVLGFVAGRFA